MNIIIYHGGPGTGKTTQLIADALRFADTFIEAGKIVANRQILKNEIGRYLFFDEFTMKDLSKIKHHEIDWLYLGCNECPNIEQIESYFKGYANVYDVRETMFPYCHYIHIEDGTHYAEFGGFSIQNGTKEDLIELIKTEETKEVSIPNVEEFKKFLDANSEIPRNFREWGLDYAYLMRVRAKLQRIKGNTIIVTNDEASAIANYNAGEIEWIEDLFYTLF